MYTEPNEENDTSEEEEEQRKLDDKVSSAGSGGVRSKWRFERVSSLWCGGLGG